MVSSDGKRPGPIRTPVSLPLPPPEPEEGTSRVRMSMVSYVPETTARDLPALPLEAWSGDDTDEEAFESVTAAVPREHLDTLHSIPPAPVGLDVNGRLPEDREAMLAAIRGALTRDESTFRPFFVGTE